MSNFENATLSKLIIHKVGNKTLEDGVELSSDPLNIQDDENLCQHLTTYFLSPFKDPVFYHFTHASSLDLNEVYTIARDLFASTRGFVKKSKDLANILYEYSTHPRIRSGELYITYIEGCKVGNELTDAVGIFKSENKETFLKVYHRNDTFNVKSDEGISIKKLDKGCIIFNVQEDDGYKVMVVDNINSSEAQYWKDEFLKLKPVSDNYFQTKHYLSLAKSFVTDRLDEEFEVTKADQIDYLNRSMDYFKKHEQFDEHEFEKEVFEHQTVIKSFKRFKGDYQDENDIQIVSEFEISNPAVKNQSRVFKSVLKLDRNFHIYIHGDKSLIERGVDDDGRKFYKIYYREES